MHDPPPATEILADAAVVAGIREAYADSRVGTVEAVEQGGFILRDPSTGRLAVARLPAGRRDSLSYPLCPDGTYQRKQIVGTFHTHPNVGPDWRQEPSPQDIRLSMNHPETMGPHQFVIASEAVYHIDNDGTVSEMGPTRQLIFPGEEDPR